ncbi:hypothetical protein HMPREF0063_10764 [Aeromicrobium marinum DSM 15272]|uniref:Uncharacterized protein n=1 Tax=Aeromicrobium marinum DSM 15272 TaxID=585531 RepID=E2S9X4_9ACTN|nr:hypothetical protein [Aeromicrobium marinum]EFQ84048.1 hypothetical protein HMPREF0063_10764 [Aeromicrobium marinum DSM 15272]
MFLWLCQLRRAPYSYDLIDNFGVRSPRRPDPSLTDLAVGQKVMRVFVLTAFEPGRSITIAPRPGTASRMFGDLSSSYETYVDDAGRTRLVGVLDVPRGSRPGNGVFQHAVAWGDLVMMRKQLRTLARLAAST